jgi:hypothetical protein
MPATSQTHFFQSRYVRHLSDVCCQELFLFSLVNFNCLFIESSKLILLRPIPFGPFHGRYETLNKALIYMYHRFSIQELLLYIYIYI